MFPNSFIAYVVCPKSKCTDFLFKCLLDSPEITSYLLQSMTLGKLQSVSNVVKNVGHVETCAQARKPNVNLLYLLFDVFIISLCFEFNFFNIA